MRRSMRASPGVLALAIAVAGAGLPWHAGAGPTEDRLARLEARLQVVSDLTLEVDRLARENSELRGTVEELQNEIEALKRRIREVAADFEQRLARQPAPGAAAGAGERPAGSQGGREVAAPAAPSAAEQADYDAAFRLLEQKKYKDAAAAFRAYLKKHPNGADVDSAQYFLGEALFIAQDNKGALPEFEAVIAKYPKSDKVPNALLRIGAIQQASGDTKAAESTLTKVVKSYPQSTAAKLAQKRLESLRNGQR
jgi:tol-pal system protein YbgF